MKAGTVADPTLLQNLSYTYDNNGNVLTIVDVKNSSQKQCFQYDGLNRLTKGTTYSDTPQGCTTQLGNGNYNETYTYNSSTGNLESKTGAGTYTYNTTHKHAVASTTAGWSFGYDNNGNMTARNEGAAFTYGYDAYDEVHRQNRLVSVSGGTNASFVYDGDGVRVKGTVGGVTTAYVGNHFEWTGSTATMKKYYYAGSTRIAVRTGTADPLWLMGDHLGSTSQTANYSGTPYTGGNQLYKPWGEKRYPSGSSGLPTTFRYTGQRQEKDLGGSDGLYYYGARWYDPSLNRWTQPDSIVPESAQGVQAWDRYSYVNNNPTTYNDPTGHNCNLPLPTANGYCNISEQEREYENSQQAISMLQNSKVGKEYGDYIVDNNVKIIWTENIPKKLDPERTQGWTNSSSIFLNEKKILSYSPEALAGLFAHEAFHMMNRSGGTVNSQSEELKGYRIRDDVREELGLDRLSINSDIYNPENSSQVIAFMELNFGKDYTTTNFYGTLPVMPPGAPPDIMQQIAPSNH